MAKFLITAWPFVGHFYPTVAIARALRERGHDCAFYSGPSACRTISTEGFATFPFRRIDEDQLRAVMFSRRTDVTETRELFHLRNRLKRWLIDTIPSQVSDLEYILNEWAPDVVVCDPTMWAPILVLHETRALKVAVGSFVPACMIPGPNAPPFGLGLPPPTNWPTKVLCRIVEWGQDRFSSKFRDAANDIRSRYGLAPISESVSAFMGRMPLYLVPSVPEFDYSRQDLPPSVHYVGPYLWNKPVALEPNGWLDRVPRHQPWVHVTEGTFHGGEPFLLRAAVKGLADLPVQVIATTGTDRDPESLGLGPIGSNIHVTRWLSHSDLLPATEVVVTTGGAGTVLATLAAGKPLLISPTEWDKPEISRRVVAAGAGLQLAPRRCSAERVRAAVMRLLTEPSFRESAQRMAVAFRRPGGASKAALLLEELAVSAEQTV